MKIYLIFIAVCFNAVAMQPADLEKQETVKRMLALIQSDYESKYDQVVQLDLRGLSARLPVICTPSTGGIFYNGDEGDFVKERTLLRELAVTKEYTPLIPVLFKRWQRLEKHWIARSMLLHAVVAKAITNVTTLLDHNVDSNIPCQYFFENNGVSYLPLEVSVGDGNSKCEPELVSALLAKGAMASVNNARLLMNAFETFYYGGENQKQVILSLLEHGARRHLHDKCSKWVGYRECGARGESPLELVTNLAKENDEDIKQRFTDLLQEINKLKMG